MKKFVATLVALTLLAFLGLADARLFGGAGNITIQHFLKHNVTAKHDASVAERRRLKSIKRRSLTSDKDHVYRTLKRRTLLDVGEILASASAPEDTVDDEDDLIDEPDDNYAPYAFDWTNIDDAELQYGEVLDYLVVGAGISGVGSVRKILEFDNTKNVRLVEARNMVGGRVTSKKMVDSEFRVELGASFITGGESSYGYANPIFDRADQEVLFGADHDFDPIHYRDQEGDRDRDEEDYEDDSALGDLDYYLGEAFDIYYYCIFIDVFDEDWDENWCISKTGGEITEASKTTGLPPYSFAQVLEWAEWDRTIYGEPAAKLAEIWLTEADLGANADQVEMGYDFTFEDFYDFDNDIFTNEFVADPRGYQHIPLSFLSDVFTSTPTLNGGIEITDDRLWLNKKVVAIQYDPNDSQPAKVVLCNTRRIAGKGLDPVSFQCKTGKENYLVVSTDKVVTTFPINVMRKSLYLEYEGLSLAKSIDKAPRFEPPLTDVVNDGLPQALEAAEMGYLAATIVKFNSASVTFDVGGTSYWTGREYLLSAQSEQGFEGSFTPYWTNYNTNALYSDSNILKIWYSSERALDVESKPLDQIKLEIVETLNEMFAGRRGRQTLSVDDIESIRQTRWSRDELAGGSYTAGRTTETFENRMAIKQFRGNWIPSGEYTCDRYAGYVHGGLLAGERVIEILNGDPTHYDWCDYVGF